jgi:hypothetical protein
MTEYNSPLTVFHKKDNLTKECQKKITDKHQYYHNHRATHNPMRRFKLSIENDRSKICTDCFAEIIIKDFK